MTQFVKNINTYLTEMKIKQSYVSMVSDIESRKLSRILKGIQDVNSEDMERIAKALGYNAEFFMATDFIAPKEECGPSMEVALYVGEPTKEQESFAVELLDLLENVDEILGAEERFLETIMG